MMGVRRAIGAALVALGGCGFGPPAPAPPSFPGGAALVAAGRARWAERKSTCAAYHYDRAVDRQQGGGVMTVQIVDDQPQWRWYVGTEPTVPDAGPALADWVDDGASVGAHSWLPPARTVEQLLDECLAVTTSPSLSVTATINEQGVPETCSGHIESCMGNACNVGITLIGFSCGTIEPPRPPPMEAGVEVDADAAVD